MGPTGQLSSTQDFIQQHLSTLRQRNFDRIFDEASIVRVELDQPDAVSQDADSLVQPQAEQRRIIDVEEILQEQENATNAFLRANPEIRRYLEESEGLAVQQNGQSEQNQTNIDPMDTDTD